MGLEGGFTLLVSLSLGELQDYGIVTDVMHSFNMLYVG
jgi:hypothetical protein